ncbi:MAG: hypothetical protein GF398_02825 [Chitinivibrionales bacterium]|nr:hypothetical protein [Chitinivibrionales bacterium]
MHLLVVNLTGRTALSTTISVLRELGAHSLSVLDSESLSTDNLSTYPYAEKFPEGAGSRPTGGSTILCLLHNTETFDTLRKRLEELKVNFDADNNFMALLPVSQAVGIH